MNWLKSLFTTASKPKKHRVLIHFDNGDCEMVMVGRMIYVPWMLNAKVPMYCEDDGTVTLRLIYGDVPCHGYGKQYGNTTWEYVK